ncbi:MAG: S8 family peptidase [Lachnospiraceae bacterium]
MAEQVSCKMRILSENYRDFIIGNERNLMLDGIDVKQVCEQELVQGYRGLYVEKELVEPMNLSKFSYSAIPNCYTLLDMEAMNQAGITRVQNYPSLQLKGEGVLIGFLDTGIDYANPVFRNLDGTTRILGIWDQTIQTGVLPKGFDYGSAYSEEDINEALSLEDEQAQKERVPTEDTNGHGTFLSSIAAGGADVENRFLGAAPESTIAVVKLKEAKTYLKDYYFIKKDAVCYQENDIMAAIRYLDELAKEKNLPMVICVALGSNLGGHNITEPLAVALEAYAYHVGRAIVIGGGNEASQRHHFLGELKNDTDVKDVEIRVGNQELGFTMELWTDIPNILAVSIVSPSGERIPRVPLRQTGSNVYRFVLEETVVYLDYKILVERSNSELIVFRFDAPTAGIWKITVESVQIADGIFHMWLPVSEFLTSDTYFLRSNPDYTITGPGNAVSPMTVAFYDGVDNSIDIHSGRGYTRNERLKPNFAAPGVNVLGAGKRGQFVRRTGSSIAAGITAGAAALLMEWIVYQLGYPDVDSTPIKNLLILGTVRSNTNTYPNREWGYGALNLYKTFDEIRQY